MKKLITLSLLLLFFCQVFGQVYIEKQTRHRFAQLNLGVDYQTSIGGKTTFLDAQGLKQSLDLGQLGKPRFLIGGTHFWGHADFLIAIPLGNPKLTKENQEVNAQTGVETLFKYYPLKIQHNKLRPFIGISLPFFNFKQKNENLTYGDGPELNHNEVALTGGFNFNYKNHLLEVGVLWNYNNRQDYYISRTEIDKINTPPLYLNFSYRLMLDTTIDAEKEWESGKTIETTNILAAHKKLDGLFLGTGMSSAFWIGESSYNNITRPYIEKFSTSISFDHTIGYYFHQSDINIAANFRNFATSTNTYGAYQYLKRKSIGLEATKFLLDYHGFVPFIGPILSYENNRFLERFEGAETFDVTKKQLSYGVTFGWDIRPNRLQTWILRTNLRWFPDLKLDLNNNTSVSFNNIEFNFIQLIVYPGRFRKKIVL